MSFEFKVGDKVQLTRLYYGNTPGTVVTVDAVDIDDPEVPYLLKFPNGEQHWGTPGDIKSLKVEPTYNVGDRVLILKTDCHGHKVGDVATITVVEGPLGDGIVNVEANRVTWWYELSDVEPYTGPITVPVPSYGMTPDQLAGYVNDFIRAAQDRVTGIGADQYAIDGKQKFEDMTISELIQMAREEAQDLAVYAAMLDIRLSRINGALKGKGISVVDL